MKMAFVESNKNVRPSDSHAIGHKFKSCRRHHSVLIEGSRSDPFFCFIIGGNSAVEAEISHGRNPSNRVAAGLYVVNTCRNRQ